MGSAGRNLHSEAGAGKPTRVGGPPVQGLYDQSKSPAKTSTPLYIGNNTYLYSYIIGEQSEPT